MGHESFFQCRLYRVFGEKYSEKISVYQEYIRAAMEKYSCDDLEAAMKCVAVLQEKSPDREFNRR